MTLSSLVSSSRHFQPQSPRAILFVFGFSECVQDYTRQLLAVLGHLVVYVIKTIELFHEVFMSLVVLARTPVWKKPLSLHLAIATPILFAIVLTMMVINQPNLRVGKSLGICKVLS